MKRKEFIDKVLDISLDRLGGIQVINNEREIIDNIIDISEELGMLPPSNNYIVRYGSQEMLDGIKVMVESHSWEPEE